MVKKEIRVGQVVGRGVKTVFLAAEWCDLSWALESASWQHTTGAAREEDPAQKGRQEDTSVVQKRSDVGLEE